MENGEGIESKKDIGGWLVPCLRSAECAHETKSSNLYQAKRKPPDTLIY
jgi:hypothetical protein